MINVINQPALIYPSGLQNPGCGVSVRIGSVRLYCADLLALSIPYIEHLERRNDAGVEFT